MTRYAPLWEQNATYPAVVDRGLIGTLWPSSVSSGGAVTTVANTMNVSVAAGTASVALASGNLSVLCRWDAPEVVTLTAAPPSGQSRIDVIVLQVRDSAIDSGSNNDFIFQAIAGTPATTGSQVAPAVPTNAYAMAQLTIAGGAANLNGVTVLDRRVFMGLAGSTLVKARAYRAAAFTSTMTTVLFDTRSYDPLSGFNLSTGLYTCPQAGDYLVVGSVGGMSNAAGQYVVAAIQRNGTSVISGIPAFSAASGNVLTSQSEDIIPCNAGDTLGVTATIYSGLNGNAGSGNTFMTVRLLG